jgi:hypothetical protein
MVAVTTMDGKSDRRNANVPTKMMKLNMRGEFLSKKDKLKI